MRQTKKTIRSSLRGPALNVFSVAFGSVALLSAVTGLLSVFQDSSIVAVSAASAAVPSFLGFIYFSWNRTGWIELDIDASSFVVQTNEIAHSVSLKKTFEWVEGRNGDFQSISFRQGSRVVLRYRNESAEDVERWRSLNRVSDRIIPSLRVSTHVGRTLHLLVRERATYRGLDDIEAAFCLAEAFSSAREHAEIELAN